MKLSATLKETLRRAAAKTSVNHIAKRAGVPQTSVAAWLSGRRGDIKLSTASRLADVLGVRLTKQLRS